jgi:hypothetical protein
VTPDEKISAVVDIMLAARRQSTEDLARLLGTSRKSVLRRLNGIIGWHAAEVACMATHWNIPVQRFYDGPEAMLSLPETPRSPGRPDLARAPLDVLRPALVPWPR